MTFHSHPSSFSGNGKGFTLSEQDVKPMCLLAHGAKCLVVLSFCDSVTAVARTAILERSAEDPEQKP